MTQAPDEHGAILRHALRAEAEAVVPSPEALEIIRARIERRGSWGLFWWRTGASIAGAVLVAGAVVMVVPGLRQQVTPEDRRITEVNHGTRGPEASGTSRPVPQQPPPHNPPEQAVVPVPVPPRPTSATVPSEPAPRQPSASPRKPTSCPSTADEAAREAREAAGKHCPPTAKPSSSPSPSPSASDSGAPCPGPAEECPPVEPEPSTPELITPTN
ncbi:hypothetical protein [Sinosporangium siamense]|uniref:Uncharacterized protein n=1 Tax=Sinosporangium siamense TaxID=1367973 RepID=A0A919R9P0_9ACTN|nr:hypothetical protein [Sinosporangium siamense]GII89965.1 hypothetical protein Ssi02_01960 [Sinosporangium siamense]